MGKNLMIVYSCLVVLFFVNLSSSEQSLSNKNTLLNDEKECVVNDLYCLFRPSTQGKTSTKLVIFLFKFDF